MRPGANGAGAMVRSLVRRLVLLALLVPLAAGPAAAFNPDEVLDDPALEERARELSAELRCMVCQNQSIDDSNAPLARDLRVLVRERLEAGDSNKEVIDYLVARYGEFVLLKPRVTAQTLLLWGAPALLLVLGLALAVLLFRRHRAASSPAPPPLTDEEQAELDRLMASGRSGPPTGA